MHGVDIGKYWLRGNLMTQIRDFAHACSLLKEGQRLVHRDIEGAELKLEGHHIRAFNWDPDIRNGTSCDFNPTEWEVVNSHPEA